jgi:hypothetical protein
MKEINENHDCYSQFQNHFKNSGTPVRLMKLQNPWGDHHEWNGNWYLKKFYKLFLV